MMTIPQLIEVGNARNWERLGKRGPQKLGFQGRPATEWCKITYTALQSFSQAERGMIAMSADPKAAMSVVVEEHRRSAASDHYDGVQKNIELCSSRPCWLGFGFYLETQVRTAMARGYKPLTKGELDQCIRQPNDHAAWFEGSSDVMVFV